MMGDPFILMEFQAAVEKYFPGERPDQVLHDIKDLRDLLKAIKREHGSVALFLQKLKNVSNAPAPPR